MLNGLVRFSVRRPGVVIGLAATLVAYGLTIVARARLDVFPEFAPPQVSIQTEAPGFSPDQVEVLVTKPIEDAINGVNGVAVLRSQSIQGLSVITAVLERGVEVREARQLLAERLGALGGRLPAAVEAPVLSPLTSSSSTVLMVGFTSERRSAMDQRTFVDWVVKPRLLATPGVAKVAIFGGEVRQLQVQVDPARLARLGLSLGDVVDAAGRATGVRGAGVLDDPNQRIVVRTEGQLATPAALGQSIVRASGGGSIRLRDVATVREGAEPKFGDGSINGGPGIVVVVSGQLGSNTKEVAIAVERVLADLAPTIAAEQLTFHPDLFRPASFIDLAVRNITVALLVGGVLVSVVLLLFLFDLRAAGISLSAIPLSLLAAIIVLDRFGYSLNTLTLGGLAIALGEVVDDAIIDVENIARRLRENRRLPEPRAVMAVVRDASIEVRHSVVYATFVVALVFAPVLTMSGVQGALFLPLGVAYILATLASLAVALTVTPALTLVLLGRRDGGAHEPGLLRALRTGYEHLLGTLLPRPGLVAAGAVAVCAGAVAVLPFFGSSFLPDFREGHYVVHMAAVPGASLEESVRLGRMVSQAIARDPRVLAVAQRAGRAELSEDTWGTHYSEIEVELKPLEGIEARTVQDSLRAHLRGFPGVSFAIRGFLTERIEETLTGSTAQIVVRIFGEDLDSLDAAARRVAGLARGIPGAVDVQYEPPAVVPEVTVRLRPGALARAGLAGDDVLRDVETATRGARVRQVYDGARATDVVVILEAAARARPEDLGALPLRGDDGRLTTLARVADIGRSTGRYLIAHQGTRRVQTVTANTRGRDVADFARELETRLAAPGLLPPGSYAELAGTATAQREAERELLVHSLLAGAVIFLLLWLAFAEPGRLLLVLANLPFSLVGGVAAVALSGATLSLGSLVGFVTLFGIATRNAVMLVSHYDHLVRLEGERWEAATALRGASERLGPILMTATVTGLALLPLALGSGDPGREIEGPMAIVILGGLVTSTVLSLFVLPTLALRYVRFRGD
ncbi:MAG: efflux RND transporter permease subunit [Gemmatimonadales bacterium]|nr:efflux RND transporter permease subunit [Gemmatimonadales bacterium]